MKAHDIANKAELISKLRTCNGYDYITCRDCPFNTDVVTCKYKIKRAAADALEADEKRIAELENDLLTGAINNPERFKIYGYKLRDLILFADMCKRNDVQESDLKKAAWNLELAVRAVMNERQEIIKNTMDEFTMRFTPDFEKAYAEMMPNLGARMRKGEQE